MNPTRTRFPGSLGSCAVLPLLLLAACSSSPSGPDDPVYPADAVPDFSVTDVNATSPTYDQAVSPRDFFGQVSAWYFGHAT